MKQRKLTLHVGLPKTATTTLQTHVFPQVPGYIGKTKTDLSPAAAEPNRRFQKVVNHHVQGGSPWSAPTATLLQGLDDLGELDVLASDEVLYSWPVDGRKTAWPFLDLWHRPPRVRPHPLTELIAALQTEANGRFNVRIILTLRNQSDFMGSLYAQLQSGMQYPSQNDFEAKVEEFLLRDDPFFDYAALVEELREVVGGDDALLLLHEDGLEWNAGRIADFLDVPLQATENLRANVRNEGPRAWRGAWTDPPVTQQGVLGRVRRVAVRMWPDALQILFQPLKQMLAGLDAASQRLFEPKRHEGVRIEVSNELAGRIRQHYGPSNLRLEQLLGRDLRPLGY